LSEKDGSIKVEREREREKDVPIAMSSGVDEPPSVASSPITIEVVQKKRSKSRRKKNTERIGKKHEGRMIELER
jgi:hypothetical protein